MKKRLAITGLAMLWLVLPAHALWQIEETLEGVDLAAQPALSPAASRAWPISVDARALEGDVPTLELQLPGYPARTAVREQLLWRSPDDLTWVGRLDEDQVILTLRRGWLAGKMYAEGRVFEIRPSAEYGTVMIELDPARFPPCGGAEAPPADFRSPARRPLPAEQRPASSADPVRLDTLLTYTPEVTELLGGHDQAAAFLQLGVDVTNVGFANSNVDVSLRMVHLEEVAAQTSNSCTGPGGDLAAAREDPALRNLREAHQADLVAVITGPGGACGCAYVQRNPGPGFFSFGYQVTRLGCVVGNLTLAHEYGHNLGMEHDPANGTSPDNASYPFAFGHFVDGDFRTIMSYATECDEGCARQPYFSNPDILFGDEPTGIANQRDNAEVARLISPIVRDFFETDDEPMPVPAFAPENLQVVQPTNQVETVSLELLNQGDGSFQWSVQETATARAQAPSGFDPALNETFHFPAMELLSRDVDNSLSWKFFDRAGGSQSNGRVIGFSLSGNVVLDPGELADNLNLVIQAPNGDQDWFQNWDFGAANQSGPYSDSFADAFAGSPHADYGLWRFWFSNNNEEPDSTMTWSDLQITLHKQALPPGCDAPASVAWIESITPREGELGGGQAESLSITINSAGLGETQQAQATLCFAINDPRVDIFEVPVSLQIDSDGEVFQDRFETEP